MDVPHAPGDFLRGLAEPGPAGDQGLGEQFGGIGVNSEGDIGDPLDDTLILLNRAFAEGPAGIIFDGQRTLGVRRYCVRLFF